MTEVEVDKPASRGPSRIRLSRGATRNHEEQPMLGPMHGATRCGAKTRRGTACQSPAVRGKRRCRMHGGAPGSGAPRGNENALKDGLYRKTAIEERTELRALIRRSHKLLQDIE